MTDIVSKQTRSRMMQNIRSVSRLEDRISRQLWKTGLRYRRNVGNMVGKPDFAIKKYRVVIFIDSCYWHSCPEHQVMPKSNTEFWKKKFNDNKRRDLEVNQYYESKGWRLYRIWEHEFRDDFELAVLKIHDFIISAITKKDGGLN